MICTLWHDDSFTNIKHIGNTSEESKEEIKQAN